MTECIRSICYCVYLCGLIAIDVDIYVRAITHPDLSLIDNVVHSSQVGV